MKRLNCLVCIFALCVISQVGGTHFRGGTITWTPNGNTTHPYKVLFTFKLGWRRSLEHCDDSVITSRTLFGRGSWNCITGCSINQTVVNSALMYCTSYSEIENWSQGERSFTHIFNSDGPFTVRYAGCCWISSLVVGADGGWSVQTSGSLAVREDTGKINTSPVSATSPIIRLQLGCFYSVNINVNDADGDEVRCRWASGTDECGGICNSLIGATLQQNPCVIHYLANTTGWHAVSLTLEDFPQPPQPHVALSQVPLQFLIRVDDVGQNCEVALHFVVPTPADGDCFAVAPGETFNETIAVISARPGPLGASLNEVLISAPVGTMKSGIHGNPPNQSIDIVWTPTPQQRGPHVLCFTALDNNGVSTQQRCVTILAQNSPPQIQSGTQTPYNVAVSSDALQHKFTVTFDQEIRRPRSSKYITVWCQEEEGSPYHQTGPSLDTSSSPAVTINNRTLTFYFLSKIQSEAICYVEMNRGSVVGLQSCGVEGFPFEGISDFSVWSFTSEVSSAVMPCSGNNGRGACQFKCSATDSKSYSCLCDKGYQLAVNKHSCHKPTNATDCPGNCNGNGVCLGHGYCDCHYGWQGTSCFEPVCYNFADCSHQGDCISPNTCQCKLGWGGPACSVDLCSIHRTCRACSQIVGCGWCDATEMCTAGTGYGPDRGSCSSWFYYACNVATSNEMMSLRGCSHHIAIIDCNKPCVDHDNPRTSGPGSQQYCSDFKTLCSDYANCFQSGSNDCVSWDESTCPFGIHGSGTTQTSKREIQRQRRDNGHTRFACNGAIKIDVTAEKAAGHEVVEETVRRIQESKIFPDDHGLLRKIAYVESKDGTDKDTFRDPSFEAGVGIWQMDKGTFEDLMKQKDFLEKRNADIKKHFGIDWNKVQRKDLYKPIVAALAARLHLSRFSAPIPKDDKGQAEYWKKYYNSYHPNAKGTVKKFLEDIKSLEKPSSQDEGCKHGVRNPSKDCTCLCEPGYKGEKCDLPDCGCQPSPCSGNGNCEISDDGEPRCVCRGRWEGDCCETCPPAPIFGDPHILTIDGFEFDFFGIGTFWSCVSRANDFGVELAFFAYKQTSVVGAAAVKIGAGVATIVTVANASGAHTIPPLRINGTLVSVGYHDEIKLVGGDVTVYVNSGTNGSAVVAYFFKFSHGATFNVEVRYSNTMQRQYLDPAIGPPIAFIQKTEGLCGTMDDNATNDLVGPDGTVYSDPIPFAESWRIPAGTTKSGLLWSWNVSNFHRRDDLGSEYFDPNHTPRYDINSYSLSARQAAQQLCINRGVPSHLLDDCIFDVVVTDDIEFADQPAFTIGKCLHDCSNHGNCLNGTCVCTGLWAGEDCSQGGCGNCPVSSQCLNGFCQCNFGYYPHSGTCVEASCSGVSDCTSADHGLCQHNDVCQCHPGYTGDDCSQRAICSDDCSGHGQCTEGDRCVCDPNWSGHRCDVPTCADYQECHGHGNCTVNATCECMPGWTGSSCGLPSCVDVNDCSFRGTCVAPNTCNCEDGLTSPDCSQELTCPLLSNCSGNGICLNQQTCLCLQGFTGRRCDFPICSEGCSSQGTCVSAGFCLCNTGWKGRSCKEPSCQGNNYCSGHGDCVDYKTCVCYANWTGPACNVPVCTSGRNDSLFCTGRGDCIGPGVCVCNSGFEGSLCGRLAAPTDIPPGSDDSESWLVPAIIVSVAVVVIVIIAVGLARPRVKKRLRRQKSAPSAGNRLDVRSGKC